ncbi:MAG: Acyl-CoA dehydrogenase [Syntrophus sp. PtaU1.Bin208]|nr:MAG: Acyl-CoA dehydrogenase [Syntrophus sp. PtaU1.Bin208]
MENLLTDETKMFQQMMHRFCEKEIKPVAGEIDEKEEYPAEILAKLAEMGVGGIVAPEQYGGSGLGWVGACIAMEELARVSAAVALAVGATSFYFAYPILVAGSEEQKEKYVTAAAYGEKTGTLALTEVNSGPDIAKIQTTAETKGDSLVLKGSKMSVINADNADEMLVFARMINDGQPGDFVLLVVDSKSPGIAIRKVPKMGMSAVATCEVDFNEVEAPKEAVIASGMESLKLITDALDCFRLVFGAVSIGILQGAFEEALSYSQSRVAFGKPICAFQAVGFYLADMYKMGRVARNMIYQTAFKADQGLDISLDAQVAKLYASESCMWVADRSLQVHGGYGFSVEYPISRFFREARLMEVGEGTSETLKETILVRLGLPA